MPVHVPVFRLLAAVAVCAGIAPGLRSVAGAPPPPAAFPGDPAAAALATSAPEAAGAPPAAAGAFDQDVASLGADAHYAGLYQQIRRAAVMILLIGATLAALAYVCLGQTRWALGVMVGAVVLFGTFFAFALCYHAFQGEPAPAPAAYAAVDNLSAGASPVARIIRQALNFGLNLLGSTVTLFVVVHGMMLAVGIAAKSLSPDEMIPFLIGSVIVFSATYLAQFFVVVNGG